MTLSMEGKTPLQSAMRLSRRYLVFVGVISFFINLSMLTVPVYMLQLYDRVLTSRSEYTLMFLTIVAIFMVIVIAVLEMTRSRILVRLGSWLDRQLRAWLAHLSLISGRDSQPIRDLDEYRTFLTGAGFLALFDAPWTPLYVAAVFVLHPLLGWIALTGSIVLFALALLTELTTRGVLSDAGRHAAGANRFTDQAARNSEVIRAMAMSPALIALWEKERSAASALQVVGSDRAGVISSVAKFFRLALQVAILGTGGWLAMKGEVSPGVMVAASIIMARALSPIEMAIGTWRQVVAARNAYRRINEFLAEHASLSPCMSLPPVTGRLAISGLNYFVPERDAPILNQVSFDVEPGQIIGITGPSAAGKSTLARMIVGVLKPTRGRICIDGFDLESWNRDELGPQLGYLPQDVELFDGRVDDNIARFDVADPDKVVAAAKQAGVYEMIAQLPDGFNTRIGLGGVMLSGGQRQRIALARAIYNNPALLVLDEPSSNLDTEGEHILKNTLNHLRAQGTTVLIIAHRPNLVTQVDKLLVLQDGSVTMFGEANEILSQITRTVVIDGPSESSPLTAHDSGSAKPPSTPTGKASVSAQSGGSDDAIGSGKR